MTQKEGNQGRSKPGTHLSVRQVLKVIGMFSHDHFMDTIKKEQPHTKSKQGGQSVAKGDTVKSNALSKTAPTPLSRSISSFASPSKPTAQGTPKSSPKGRPRPPLLSAQTAEISSLRSAPSKVQSLPSPSPNADKDNNLGSILAQQLGEEVPAGDTPGKTPTATSNSPIMRTMRQQLTFKLRQNEDLDPSKSTNEEAQALAKKALQNKRASTSFEKEAPMDLMSSSASKASEMLNIGGSIIEAMSQIDDSKSAFQD